MNLYRLKKLQSLIEAPILIKKKENLFYLTGRSFMHGYLLVFPLSAKPSTLSPIFLGDGLENSKGLKSDLVSNLPSHLNKGGKLLLENQFTFAEYNYIRAKCKGLRAKIEHVRSPVDFQRAIKDKLEIALVKKSMQIVEQVFSQVKKQLKQKTWTEQQLAEFIKIAGLKLGAEEESFPAIVASGANAAIPHHVKSGKKLKIGESIILDFGFKTAGYCSDFTRTVFLGKIPSKIESAYNQVEKAYNDSISASVAGKKASEIYDLAVKVLAEKSLDKYFIHSLGHGTGLEVHELPNLSPRSKDVLQNSMIFSIEPGVYFPKKFGIRIEDLVYLENNKCKKFISIPTKLENNIL